MQTFLFESPLWLTVCGLFVALMAGFVWTQTGARSAWITSVIAATVTILLVFISVQVVTDREKINRTIHAVAEAVEANDLKRVASYIHPNAAQNVTQALTELPRYTFREARMTRLRSIVVNRNIEPPSAVAEFHGIIDVSIDGQHARIPRFVKTYFVEDGGVWKVRDYEHFDVATGFRN